MNIPPRARLAENETEILQILKMEEVAISECILREIPHKCLHGIHVYVLGSEQEDFIREKFPTWKFISRNTVSAFCIIGGASLKGVLREIRSKIKETNRVND